MSVGGFARALLGERFHTVAGYYRRLFVDLDAVARIVGEELPSGASVLDVGGGDGAPLNYLLARRPDVSVTMLDPSAAIGGAIEGQFSSRVTLLANRSLEQFDGPAPDAILLIDVFHHVPQANRQRFLSELRSAAERFRVNKVIVKDLEPGSLRSALGWISDRYVTGDPHVRFIAAAEFKRLLQATFGDDFAVGETRLRNIDAPNYCLVVSRNMA